MDVNFNWIIDLISLSLSTNSQYNFTTNQKQRYICTYIGRIMVVKLIILRNNADNLVMRFMFELEFAFEFQFQSQFVHQYKHV